MTAPPTQISVNRALNTLIEGAYWPACLETGVAYTRRQDDTDGATDSSHSLTLIFGPDGDAWIDLPGANHSLRFRSWAGGGQSIRTRNALLVLAEAMRRDNEERPQRL